MGTLAFTIVLITDCAVAPWTSAALFRPMVDTGQTSGCLLGSKSEAVSIPCSRLSMCSATASRKETEQRCPVTLMPCLCASLIAAPSSARLMSVYALIQVAPSDAQ